MLWQGRTRFAVFVYLLLLFGLTVEARNTAADLKPPVGNSLFLRVKTQNGRQMYQCLSKKWEAVGASADLVMADDTRRRAGVFTYRVAQEHGKSHGTWVLKNPVDDIIESGSRFSSVSGKEIIAVPTGNSIAEALIQATSHHFDGIASLVSYIQLLFPEGGILPSLNGPCIDNYVKISVPYEAQYWLWRQDPQPPPTPKPLSVTSERAVEGLFGEGAVMYRFNGEVWEQMRVEANLYNIPGGTLVGKYLWENSGNSKRAGDSSEHRWQLWNPISFQLTGAISAAISITRNSLPWCLVTVTHHSGNISLLGEYAHVQILSTRGGVPSTHASSKTVPNMIWRAPFSAIFWFYTRSAH